MEGIRSKSIVPLRACLMGIAIFLAFGSCLLANEQNDWRPVLDLRGDWKFETGDDMKRAEVSFDDSKWSDIFVPAKWEYEGYPHYDGYAWYRIHFKLPENATNNPLYLRVGRIDDAAEIFLNGKLIGVSGSLPPDYKSAYSVEVNLPISQGLLNQSGDNVIAVRVYDEGQEGGIVEGRVGLFDAKQYRTPNLALQGMWKFKRGDDDAWKGASLDDNSWKEIFVPAFWESQGYPKYDGMGWYRLHFKVPSNLVNEKLVLLLGRIDDLDETYINGEEIGHTGRIRSDPWDSHMDDEYSELREYTIPSGLLKADGDNVIAVRVYDGGGWGGIYEGPIGIMTKDRYRDWRHHRPWNDRFRQGFWDVFEGIFD